MFTIILGIVLGVAVEIIINSRRCYPKDTSENKKVYQPEEKIEI